MMLTIRELFSGLKAEKKYKHFVFLLEEWAWEIIGEQPAFRIDQPLSFLEITEIWLTKEEAEKIKELLNNYSSKVCKMENNLEDTR